MIADEVELRWAIQWMSRMYDSQEREAGEPVWTPEWRQEMAEQTQGVRQGLEREVAEYLAQKYCLTASASSQESPTLAHPAEQAA